MALEKNALRRAYCLAFLLSCGGVDHGPYVDADAAGIPAADLVWRDLIDHSHWSRYDAAEDPLASHQPETIECGLTGFFIERGELEVNTGECNYALLEHSTQLAVAAGTELELELRHFDLLAPEPATAHVALLLEDAVQWEATIDVPHAAQVVHARVPATRALREGGKLRLHLHNHGQNTWTLAFVRARVPASD